MARIEYRFGIKKRQGSSPRDLITIDRVLPDHKVPQGMTISFERTVRVPDNSKVNALPPNLGSFPLHKVQDFVTRFPPNMACAEGVFFPMYQKEAMWLSFHATSPFLLKIYVGGVNAISGELSTGYRGTRAQQKEPNRQGRTLQDYLVVPQQPWLDGVAIKPGKVQQFVATATGQGYSVEAQLTGRDDIGGLQFEITPARYDPKDRSNPYPFHRAAPESGHYRITILVKILTGKNIMLLCNTSDTIYIVKNKIYVQDHIPPNQQRLVTSTGKDLKDEATLWGYDIQNLSTLFVLLRLRGGSRILPKEEEHTLDIAPGGLIKQSIRKDNHDPNGWLKDYTFTIPVYILSTARFRQVTGTEPPPCPISATTYAKAGLPFYKLYKEPSSDVSGADAFASLRSINQIENAQGIVPGEETMVHPRTVNWYYYSLGSKVFSHGEVFHVDDPDGLISPARPLEKFCTLADLMMECDLSGP